VRPHRILLSQKILYHVRGVMIPPKEMLTVQGYDLQFGTNVLGNLLPFRFVHAHAVAKDIIQGISISPSCSCLFCFPQQPLRRTSMCGSLPLLLSFIGSMDLTLTPSETAQKGRGCPRRRCTFRANRSVYILGTPGCAHRPHTRETSSLQKNLPADVPTKG
jgi:hypothetical protein